jgi:hypothetical protein
MRNHFFFGVICFVLFSCAKNASDVSSSVGKGGSLTKFTIAGNYLYAVSAHYIYAIDISNPAAPVKASQSTFNVDIETIYPFKNRLFIGSRTGLYIYSIDDPANPKLIGEAKHGRSCDPVVASDSVSYSTLKGSKVCGPETSGLYVYDVRKIEQPELKKTIPINEPVGLGIADSALFVCAGSGGLKVYSITNPYNPLEKNTITGANYIDVIPDNNLLICWVADGIMLYDISNRFQPSLLNKITN